MKYSSLLIVALASISTRSTLGESPATPAKSATPPQREILTPPAPETPRINGPSVFGARPGSPFLFAIPATGKRPMKFLAQGLPAGLKLDAATGQITGKLPKAGEHDVTLRARNALGSAEKKFRIVAGEKIALTPAMGWNSWNCWAGAVDQEKVLSAARAFVANGLAQHGWSYVNIDDTWQGKRGGPLNAVQPNRKFPDMQALCDEIHRMGLKAGIYSTPFISSYANFAGGTADTADGAWPPEKKLDAAGKERGQKRVGSFTFYRQDAQQWAEWGFDYLKYDWNPNRLPEIDAMAKALRESGRDFVYSLSNNAPFALAADLERLANSWRTTGDINDSWKSVSGIGFSQDRWAPFAGPGHWNDPDMLVIGKVGWGPHLHPSNLTPDEQYTHISLWCLLSAPLLLGCDLAQLDDFTLGLLTNDEVLAIDQDSLGQEATQVSSENGGLVYAKPLEDGSMAVGLFNTRSTAAKVTVTRASLKKLPEGKLKVRDLWRQKDLGAFGDEFTADVPPHGVVLLRLIK